MQLLPQQIIQIRQQHRDFLLILLLFFSFRVMMLMAYATPCLMFCSDYLFYYEVVDSAQQGHYPFIDFWYEFPPIFPYLSLGAYYLAQGVFQKYITWLGLLLLLFESGTLILLYLLARRLYDQPRALKLSWVYSVLFAPFYFWRSTFDSLTTFLILLALYILIRRKYGWLGLSVGLGVMAKYLPLILLPVIYRHSGLKRACQTLTIVLGISLIIFGPFFIVSPEFAQASLQANLSRSSWQTIWALIDGNLEAGDFGPVSNRFDPAKAATPLYNPPKISPWLTLLLFGGLGLYLLRAPVGHSINRDVVRFAALTLTLFFLWSKGWSPQWQMYLFPLILLSLSLSKALTYIVALSLINLLEWPTIYQRGLTQLLPLTIVSRTVLFGLLAYELYSLTNSLQERQATEGKDLVKKVDVQSA